MASLPFPIPVIRFRLRALTRLMQHDSVMGSWIPTDSEGRVWWPIGEYATVQLANEARAFWRDRARCQTTVELVEVFE